MRIIKLGKGNLPMSNVQSARDTLLGREPAGKFFCTRYNIESGEWLIVTYDSSVAWVAKSSSGVMTDKNGENYFCVDVNSLKAGNGRTTSALQQDLKRILGIDKNISSRGTQSWGTVKNVSDELIRKVIAKCVKDPDGLSMAQKGRQPQKYLFCNVGWMNSYEGNTLKDSIEGGGSSDIKYEVCNFLPINDKLFGYVQPSGPGAPLKRRIAVEKIVGGEAIAKSPFEKDVFVIWTAPRPDFGCAVVGWYKNATVYRELRPFETASKRHSDNFITGYRIVAKASDSKLLPIDERIIRIPRSGKALGKDSGAMGNSNVWFGDSDRGRDVAEEVWKLANGNLVNPKKGRGWPTNPNTKLKREVEDAAIKAVTEYYEKNGYDVKSVERDNVGWDLEATLEKTTLQIEVKGLSGSAPVILLSPNEYKAFGNKSRNYRLAIVRNALKKPTTMFCHYCNETNRWKVMGDASSKVAIDEKVGAQITVKK